MKTDLKSFGTIWLVGSIITIVIVGILWSKRDYAAATAVILISPFPCPTGLPC